VPHDKPLPAGDPIISAIENLAATFPERLAVKADGQSLSYAELNARANRLAHWLREQQAGPDDLVALRLGRGVHYIVATIAVLKSGAAYLPIDPITPASRTAQIVSTAGARLLLSDTEHAGRGGVDGDRLVLLDTVDLSGYSTRNPVPLAVPDNLAYVVHTSGSTGTPKGVMVTRRGLTNLVAWDRSEFAWGPADRATLVASTGFDGSVWELWSPLTCGASLHVPDADTMLSPEKMLRWLADQGITVTYLPTALAELVLGMPWPEGSSLRVLRTGGDLLHLRPPASAPFRLVNAYGPTENTAVSTYTTVAPIGGTTIPAALPSTVTAAMGSHRPATEVRH
jgi:non-ribosomal peptide synthetase component F